MQHFLSVPLLVWLAGAVSAHTIFQELYVNGVSQGHLQGIRMPDYDGVCFTAFSCNCPTLRLSSITADYGCQFKRPYL